MNIVRQKLAQSFTEACEASASLGDSLVPYYEACPSWFPAALDEMSVTDKLRMARDLLKLLEGEDATI